MRAIRSAVPTRLLHAANLLSVVRTHEFHRYSRSSALTPHITTVRISLTVCFTFRSCQLSATCSNIPSSIQGILPKFPLPCISFQAEAMLSNIFYIEDIWYLLMSLYLHKFIDMNLYRLTAIIRVLKSSDIFVSFALLHVPRFRRSPPILRRTR